MVNEREELQRILTELKGLLDEVLRVASDVTDEQIPPTRLIAIGLNVDDRPIVDNLMAAVDDAAPDVLRRIDLSEADPRLGPLSADRAARCQDSTTAREHGALMSVADELMLAISIGPGSLDLGIRARATALEPRQIDHTAEIASFDLPIETTRDHRRCAHRTRRPLTGWASLTDAERRVAELVSLGLTNREIGHQMFLSRHTVDDHLRHIFAKLGINTRVQLERYERVWSMRSGS